MLARLTLGLLVGLATAPALAAPAAIADDLLVAPRGPMTGDRPSAPPKGAAAPSPAAPAAGAPAPDESALRYWAATGQRARAEREIERLRRLYRGWQPPGDLWDTPPPGDADEAEYWELFAADRLDDIDAAIARREQEEPGWRPSADLVHKIARKRQRARLLTLARDGRTGEVLELATSGLRADAEAVADAELLWTIAEAQAKSGDGTAARDTFAAVLRASEVPAERLTTVQKALALLSMVDVEPLIAMGRPQSDGRSEFAALLTDIVRARMEAFLHGQRQDPVEPAEVGAYEDAVLQRGTGGDIGLLGWYRLKLGDNAAARSAFERAVERGAGPTASHGLALALRGLGLRREAEEIAYAWRDPQVLNLVLYLDLVGAELRDPSSPTIAPDRLARYARTVMEVGSGDGAQTLGWYAWRSCQTEVAFEWFGRAMAWHPSEGAAQGYAIAALRLDRRKELYETENRFDGLFPKLMEVLFPDGTPGAPNPCAKPGAPRPKPQPTGAFTVPGPADPIVETAATRADLPNALPSAALAFPKISRADFPVAVDPENPMRAPVLARTSAAASMPPVPGGFAPEPVRTKPGLVARRVPGVGPMPYERWGFQLLPGWNGVAIASYPTAATEPPVAGTRAAEEALTPDPAPARIVASPAFGAASPRAALRSTFSRPN